MAGRYGSVGALAWVALSSAVGCGGADEPIQVGDPGGAGGAAATSSAGSGGQGSGGVEVSPGGGGGAAPVPASGGELPDVVYFRTMTESFNRLYYLAVRDGGLWVKPNVERTGVDGAWTRVALPAGLDGRVAQVSVDDHGIVVFDVDRNLTWTMSGALSTPLSPTWQTSWGAPLATGPGFQLPDPIKRWEYAVLTVQEDQTWTDTAGNAQAVGLGTVAHIWILGEGGQRITFVDPILPVDLSYEMCGPLRGRFQSENLSVSGSTSFVINRFGDMYTRLYDFDISGADTLFFQYSYEDQRGVAVPAFQLPAPAWVQQPKIDGEVTDRITIFKTGFGSDSRTLRVEGRDPDGNEGFFEKTIAAPASADWVFHRTDEPLRGTLLENSAEDRSLDTLGLSEDRPYVRNVDAIASLSPSDSIATDADWAGEITDFNLYCSPATLTIHAGPGSSVDLVLHTVDSIRQTPRARGLDDNPYVLQGTIEVPQALLDGLEQLDPKLREFITTYLGGKRFTATAVSATTGALSLDGFGWVFEHRVAP